MLGNDAPILTDDDAIGISLDLDRASDRAGRDRVLVVVEAHQAGLGDRGGHGMEAVEATGIGDELRSLSLSNVLKRNRGVKKRSRTSPTWFSTWPFSQPDAGVQATGSTR